MSSVDVWIDIVTSLLSIRRRNIVVFSADLAAFTIPHADDGSPLGSDLLLLSTDCCAEMFAAETGVLIRTLL